MSHTCLELITDLTESIDKNNYQLIDNMTKPNMSYKWICIKPNVLYDYFYQNLKVSWEKSINDFINRGEQCTSMVSNILSLYDLLQSGDIQNVQHLLAGDIENGIIPEDLMLDFIANMMLKPYQSTSFEMDINAKKTLTNLLRILYDYCHCQRL